MADNSGPAAGQLGLTSQTLIFVENFSDCIQPTERSQVHVRECLVNLRQPTVHGGLNPNRHEGIESLMARASFRKLTEADPCPLECRNGTWLMGPGVLSCQIDSGPGGEGGGS